MPQSRQNVFCFSFLRFTREKSGRKMLFNENLMVNRHLIYVIPCFDTESRFLFLDPDFRRDDIFLFLSFCLPYPKNRLQ